MHSTESLSKVWLLTLSVMALEVLGGWYAGSLALLADAGHMFSDIWALSISLFAAYMAQKKSWHALETWAAGLNTLTLTGTGIAILYSALQRWNQPTPVHAYTTLVVASIGLLANIIGLRVLKPHNHNINIRGAFLHLLADTLSSVAVIVSACVIAYTGWTLIDPLISALIACVIIVSSLLLGWRVIHTSSCSKKSC
jgi:cobalt-zinc-cadmium efflux system protein